MLTEQHSKLVEFIWSIAERLRGPYRPPQYRKVMLPLIVLRRLDMMLEDSKAEVCAEYQRLKAIQKANKGNEKQKGSCLAEPFMIGFKARYANEKQVCNSFKNF